jgi:hypothetical protein
MHGMHDTIVHAGRIIRYADSNKIIAMCQRSVSHPKYKHIRVISKVTLSAKEVSHLKY